jgi:hypothetical protein
MNSHPKKYQDYVIKNGKLVGDFEGLYKDVEDPWNQSRDDHLNDYRRQIAILGCQRLREKFSCNQVLELGCGFGFIADQLRTLGFTCCGTDISQTAILKANIIHPLTQFKCSPYNNLHLINELKPDIVIMSELTWYVLESLDDFLLGLRDYAKSVQKPIFLIHLLAVYRDGIQKYGLDKFTNLSQINNYFNMDYLSSGYIETKLQDDAISLGTYFIARIC